MTDEMGTIGNKMKYRKIWERDVHQRLNSRSILKTDLILVPERGTWLTRLDPANGSPVWETKIINTWGWLAHNDDSCFWLNQHSVLMCINLEHGGVTWSRDLSGNAGSMFGYLICVGNQVLTGGWRGYSDLVSLDSTTGNELWRFECRNEPIGMPALCSIGVAIPFLEKGEVIFLNANDGVEISRIKMPSGYQRPDASPMLNCFDNHLLLAIENGIFYTMRPGVDDQWSTIFRHASGIRTVCPPIIGGQVIFQDNRDQLTVYDLDSGSLLWLAEWRHNRSDLLPVTKLGDGCFVVGSSFGFLAIIDAEGHTVVSDRIGKRVESNIASIEPDVILSGTSGAVMAIQPN